MSRSETKKKLKDSIENGLVVEIHRAEQAYFLLKAIGNHVSAIDALENGKFIGFFYTIQMALQTEAILAMSRLYDKANQRFPTRCIYQLLHMVESESSNLPLIYKRDFRELEIQLQSLNIREKTTRLLYTDQKKFAEELSEHFKNRLKKRSVLQTLEKLKTIRDKRFSHNEKVFRLKAPSYNKLEKLLDNAKEIVGAIGWLYLDTAYTNNGKYFLSSDTELHCMAMDSLIEKLTSLHEL